MTYKEAKIAQPLAKSVYDTLIKIGWKGWSPQVGEWCIYFGDPRIKKENKNLLGLIYGIQKKEFLEVMCEDRELMDHRRFFTTILEWEEIERIIKLAGYRFDICPGYECTIIGQHSKCLAKTIASSRQEAVCRAVIALGKELKCQ